MANTSLLCLKVLLLACGVVSMSIMLLPSISDVIPNMLRSFSGWLKPPYLYFIINGIIICIAASSRFHYDDMPEPETETDTITYPPPARPRQNVMAVDYGVRLPVEEDERDVVFEEKSVVVVEKLKNDFDGDVVLIGDNNNRKEFVKDEFHFPAEKHLVSARFGHRKPLKTPPQGEKKLRVSKSKRHQQEEQQHQQHDTLENTWRMITEGKGKPLTRQVNRMDAWENEGCQMERKLKMKKSETFTERTNRNVPAGKLRKEPSLSQEELNKRVEAFINKFNEDMRLQRLQSLEQNGMLADSES